MSPSSGFFASGPGVKRTGHWSACPARAECAFSARISASSQKLMQSSQSFASLTRLRALASATTRPASASSSGTAFQAGALTTISTLRLIFSRRAGFSRAPPFIGADDFAHEIVADDVAFGECHMADASTPKAGRWLRRGRTSGPEAGRSCEGSPVTIMREPSPRRVRNIFICIEVAFCASSSRTQALRQRAPAHEGERRDFNHAGLHPALDHARVHEVMQPVVDRAQIGIDLFAHVAGQKAKALASFDGGARQDQALDHALFQQRHRMTDREPGLACASGTFGENQLMALQRAQIEILRSVAGAHRAALARADLLEAAARRFRRRKRLPLPRAFLDGAVDVAEADVLAQLTRS